MKTLFVKLFLWFWLASTISGLISFALAVNMRLAGHHRHLPMEHAQRSPHEGRSMPTYDPSEIIPIPPDIWVRIVVSIIFGGASCYALAWYMTAPVRTLRTAAQRLASGDLSARVALKIRSGRNDEMVDLGQDFNRMAERIESLVSVQKQLVRDVSHELRSPLARLNVALGLARRGDGAALETALDRIELESERLNYLIGDLLTLSLLDGGGDVLAKSLLQLCALVSEVVSDADFEAASRNRQVLLTGCDATTLSGNRELLRRTLENIVRNAVRYTAEGSAVEVSLGSEHGEAVLRVRDHGPGVPESAVTDIFLPFYRVAHDRDRHSGGAGIGLAIAERTVRLSGGIIRARNVPDGGLEIEIRIPIG